VVVVGRGGTSEERAAARGRDAQRREEVRAAFERAQLLRLAASRQLRVDGVIDREVLDRRDARLQRSKRAWRPRSERLSAIVGLPLPRRQDLDQPIGVGIRERAPQDAVGDRKDRGVEADAECERRESGEGERGIASHQSQRMAHVLRERLDRPEQPRVARLFAQAQRIAKLAACGKPRVVAGHVFVDERLRLQVLVEAQLVGQILVELIPAEDEQQTSE
jgi:hypothetical protein